MPKKKQSVPYTESFRREAVRRSEEEGTSAIQVAKELGIHVNQIYNWRWQFKRLEKSKKPGKQFHTMKGVDYSKEESEEIRRLKREVAELKVERDFLKKSDGILRETKKVKYAYIESKRSDFKITKMCDWLEVSRSGYYKWRSREPSKRSRQRELVRCAVVDVYHQFKKCYGAPRLTVELNDMGVPCCVNHVAQLLQIEGLKACNGKSFKYHSSAYATYNVAPNLLARNFDASKPDEKWVSDITYIDVDGVWMHLAVIMDLVSRQIIGWAVDETMTTELVLEAFQMAVGRRQTQPGLILHSDRGVQHRAGEYRQTLEEHKVRPSMSRKGNCWDNAVMESFFSRLKVELVYMENFKTDEQAYQGLFE